MSRDTFHPEDLKRLGRLYHKASTVEAMVDVLNGARGRRTIGLRHDVDHSLENAMKMAEWEAARGVRSTYFFLHTAQYWKDRKALRRAVEFVAEHDHEIGLHNNAVVEAMRTGRSAVTVFREALDELRSFGFYVWGTVAHGDADCYVGPMVNRKIRVVNDEMFVECARPQYGAPDRVVKGTNFRLDPVPLSYFGLEYEASWLGRHEYLSDSGGKWNPGKTEEQSRQRFLDVERSFPYAGQLHMLVHPDWWGAAFA